MPSAFDFTRRKHGQPKRMTFNSPESSTIQGLNVKHQRSILHILLHYISLSKNNI